MGVVGFDLVWLSFSWGARSNRSKLRGIRPVKIKVRSKIIVVLVGLITGHFQQFFKYHKILNICDTSDLYAIKPIFSTDVS